MAHEPLFRFGAPHDARGDDDPQRREIPSLRLGIERRQHRFREGITDDEGALDPLALECVEELIDREAGRREGDDGAPEREGVDRVEQPGAVHEWTGRQADRPWPGRARSERCRIEFVAHRLLVGGIGDLEQVVLSPHDSLGHAGRTAGVEQQQIVATASRRWVHPVARICGGNRLVGLRPLRTGRAVAVVDPEPGVDARQCRIGSALSFR